MRIRKARLGVEHDGDVLDVERHGHGVLIAGASFSDIRAAAGEVVSDDLFSRQIDALAAGHEWQEPESYEDAVLPNTSPLVALRFASQRQGLARWNDWYRGTPHHSLPNRIADDDRLLVTILDGNSEPHGAAAEFSVEEFLQLAEFSDVEAFELRCDLLKHRRSVVFAQAATYRVEVVESSPKSRNKSSQNAGDVLHPS
jgi:hypothetical protein